MTRMILQEHSEEQLCFAGPVLACYYFVEPVLPCYNFGVPALVCCNFAEQELVCYNSVELVQACCNFAEQEPVCYNFEVLSITGEHGSRRVHIHFFEGNVQQAKEIERRGYMVSVPPLESAKRMRALREIAIDNIMAESDAPAAGDSPMSVRKSIEMIAAAKDISFEAAAEATTLNTKKFFGLCAKAGLMRS